MLEIQYSSFTTEKKAAKNIFLHKIYIFVLTATLHK